MRLFSKAQERGQIMGDALSDRSENKKYWDYIEVYNHWIAASLGEMKENKCSYLKKPWGISWNKA